MSDRGAGRGVTLFGACGLYLTAGVGLWLSTALFYRMPVFFASDTTGLLTALYYHVPFLLIPLMLFVAVDPGHLRAFRPRPFLLRHLFLTAAAVFLASGLLDAISLVWLPFLQKLGVEVLDAGVMPQDAEGLMRCTLAVVLLIPLLEEALFRGVMLTAWEGRGYRRAVWATAILYALAQGSFIAFPSALAIGVISAALVLRTRSVYPGMLFHCCLKAVQLFQNYGTSISEAELEAMRSDLSGYLGNGVMAGAILTGIVTAGALTFLLRRRGRVIGRSPSGRVPLPEDAAIMLMCGAVTFFVYTVLDLFIA